MKNLIYTGTTPAPYFYNQLIIADDLNEQICLTKTEN